MTDDGLVMERGRVQVIYSYSEGNVIDMGDLGIAAEVQPWRNSYETEDIDKEQIITEIQNRAGRCLNRITGRVQEDPAVENVGIYQPL